MLVCLFFFFFMCDAKDLPSWVHNCRSRSYGEEEKIKRVFLWNHISCLSHPHRCPTYLGCLTCGNAKLPWCGQTSKRCKYIIKVIPPQTGAFSSALPEQLKVVRRPPCLPFGISHRVTSANASLWLPLSQLSPSTRLPSSRLKPFPLFSKDVGPGPRELHMNFPKPCPALAKPEKLPDC